MIVLQMQAQNRLLVAIHNKGKDSVRYFYDKENILRSDILYKFIDGSFQPETMRVYPPAEDPNFSVTFTYKYDIENASWKKFEKFQNLISTNKVNSETSLWDNEKKDWFCDKKYESYSVYDKNILLETETIYCFDCANCDNSSKSLKVIFDYDNKDSLIIKKFSSKNRITREYELGNYDSFHYNFISDTFLIKTHYRFEKTNNQSILARREVHHITRQKHITYIYINKNGSEEYAAKHLKYYDQQNRLIIKEKHYYNSTTNGFPVPRKHEYSYNANGLLQTHTYYAPDGNDSGWKAYQITENSYTSGNQLSSTTDYYKNFTTNIWIKSGGDYFKYNQFDQLIESGSFSRNYWDTTDKEMDSSWKTRYYYNDSAIKYKHAGNASFLVHPNPGNGIVNANIYSEDADELEFILMDMHGKIIFFKNIPVSPGANSVQILSAENLSSAMYIYSARSKSGKFYKRDKLLIIR